MVGNPGTAPSRSRLRRLCEQSTSGPDRWPYDASGKAFLNTRTYGTSTGQPMALWMGRGHKLVSRIKTSGPRAVSSRCRWWFRLGDAGRSRLPAVERRACGRPPGTLRPAPQRQGKIVQCRGCLANKCKECVDNKHRCARPAVDVRSFPQIRTERCVPVCSENNAFSGEGANL